MNYYLDLDGTLIDSTKRHGVLLNDILTEMNLENIDEYELMDYKKNGYSTYSYLTNIKKIDDNVVKIIVEEWQRKIEKEEYLQYDMLYDDTIDFLDYISRDKNNKIYFLTARQNREGLLKQLKNFDLMKYVKEIFVVSPINAVEGKKQKILNTMNGYKTIIFGDSEVDYQVAEQLNINYFILNRGFRNKKYWDSKNIKSYNTLLSYEVEND